MIIKKYQAETETEAMMMAKNEMGSAAVIMNVKTIKQRGFAKLFKKDMVEVTAALEDKVSQTERIPAVKIDKVADDGRFPELEVSKPNAIEEKLNNLTNMLEGKMNNTNESKVDPEVKKTENENTINIKFIQLVYRQLLDNEVDEKYANQIIGEIQSSLKKESNVDSILAGIYQKIILKLGQPKAIEIDEKLGKVVFFVGPTGVGKTTTIAKLASYFKIQKKAKVALITSDTYRIAAAEQLRTYANILDVPISVVYTVEEFNQAVKLFEDYDLIFVDTAGRSHKDNEQCREMYHLIDDCVVGDKFVKEVYVVLSAATKYKDLLKINDVYKNIKNYSLLFTKLDETTCLGNILNMKLTANVPLSYVTSGQAVPDDIAVIDAQKIARNLLGEND